MDIGSHTARTATAAELLGQAGDVERRCEAWIVDEASMLSARDSEALLSQAREAEARLILVGDVRQLGSVEAGRAFGQLQEHGMPTHVLDQIVRQTNTHTRKAVEAILAGEAAPAFEAIDKGGGRIVEQGDDALRYVAMALRPRRYRRSRDGASGELPRQYRRCSGGLCRHQQGEGCGRALHRQPRQAHRSARSTRWRTDRGDRRGAAGGGDKRFSPRLDRRETAITTAISTYL
ncbi:AAA family ATPase [Erythrobacter pelagi]|uniref:AAA family ATPase n=1 Tax=Qipengyuania pelagi TaxID=994320 RepID=A0A844Y9R4_9SPHN|nr:AAA family ATPase [Qipengyuania pelagi]